jgi:WD40 repeat protein
MLVHDGVEGQPYDSISDFVFSPDSQHIAYAVRKGALGTDGFVVKDGNEGKHYAEARSPTFSPDSQRLAYVAVAPGEALSRLVVDEVPGKPFYGISDVVFSPDSKRLGYIAGKVSGKVAVIDGRESKEYPNVMFLIVSPNSKRFAYFTQLPSALVIDDAGRMTVIEIALYAIEASTIRFTSENRLAYYVAGKEYLVEEGE